MKSVDSIDQIIDLEYFLHQDVMQQPEALHQRDRAIALELSSEGLDSLSNSQLLSGWTQSRITDEFSDKNLESPGTIFKKSRALATTLCGAKGLIAGLMTGIAFFAYAGTTPINVLQFLIFFVFSQLLLVSILLGSLLLHKVIPALTLSNSSFSLIYTVGKRFFRFLHQKWFSALPAQKRDAALHAFGIIKRSNRLYGPLFYWPLFKLNQLFGISFNLGLLSSCLVKIVTSDLAFGWQSTLQISSNGLHKLVQFLAAPWAWIFPETTPTLAQIEGSRIILKDGIYHLLTTDLVAWWPFLILCLVVYGLLIRLFFYLLAIAMERGSLKKQQFQSSQCQTLLRRMRAPVVSTQAAPEQKEEEVKVQADQVKPEEKVEAGTPQIVLVPDDIFDSLSLDYLQTILKDRGFTLKAHHRFMEGYEQDQDLLDTLGKIDWSQSTGIFILMEGWMVPLVDFISYLNNLRELAGPETSIEIGLTGKLENNEISKIDKADMDIWWKKVSAIGDPYTEVVAIAGINQ